MYKPLKLTKKTARELIGRICSRLDITKEETASNAITFRASTGPSGLEIRCENDWFNNNGRIKLTISDGKNHIIQYFYPDTLNRDYVAEQCDKDDEQLKSRRDWVWTMGKERAHKFVDQYWEG